MSDNSKPVDITSAPGRGVRKYGGDSSDARPPFEFQVGNSPVVKVFEPDAGIIMDIEESQSTRAILRLFLGDDYTDIEEHLEGLRGDDLVELARDLSRHFGLYDTQASVNRAQRRRANRRG